MEHQITYKASDTILPESVDLWLSEHFSDWLTDIKYYQIEEPDGTTSIQCIITINVLIETEVEFFRTELDKVIGQVSKHLQINN